MNDDTTTAEQRAYFHTLRFLIAEAERPRTSGAMKVELTKLYHQTRRVARLKSVPWDVWQANQEQALIDLMDEQCIPVPEDLRMAANA